MEVWLVVQMFLIGQPGPITLEDSKQPSIEACIARAREPLEKSAGVDSGDGWEIAVSCNVGKKSDERG